MEIQHFSHEHPLNFCEHDNLQPYLCGICGLPILQSPSYSCRNPGCKFFLHQPCAQLPQKLNYRCHRPHPFGPHPFFLKEKLHPRKSCKNFTYSCSICKLDLHPLLVVPVEIKSTHQSHQSHPLQATCREIISRCDACGRGQKGFFFSCNECNFWIHEDCTLFPNILNCTSHRHPVILRYNFDHGSDCQICYKELRGNGCYFCGRCSYNAHLYCATSHAKNLTSETRIELIQLPDEGDTFPNSTICRAISEGTKDDNNKLNVEKYHNHTLIYHDNVDFFTSNDGEECSVEELACNACVQPISSSFYTCSQPGCNILIHNSCKILPSCMDSNYLSASHFPDSSKYFFSSIFPCFLCHRPCNGFCYYFDISSKRAFLDLECASVESAIKHASHRQHFLVHEVTPPVNSMKFNCCCGKPVVYFAYRCTANCDFMIHIECALLPKMVRHKFDKHWLELITDHSNKQDYNSFCELCEQDINQQFWFYHCAICDQSFHVKCIPSVGYLSKVKFGGTLNISSIHHDHPVTLIRMLMEGNQRCGYCKKIIHGFVDDMAFHCSKCYFWIHFTCAKECATNGASQLMLFSEAFYGMSKDILENVRQSAESNVGK